MRWLALIAIAACAPSYTPQKKPVKPPLKLVKRSTDNGQVVGGQVIFLEIAYASLHAARETFQTWDREYQAKLMWASDDVSKGDKAVREYREKREPILLKFQQAYTAMAAASITPTEENVNTLGVLLYELHEAITDFYWQL